MATKVAEKVQSVRLTEDMRRDITRALIAHKLDKREADLAKLSHKLALRVYQNQFSAADRRKMEALPEGWLSTIDHVSVKVGGDYRTFTFGPADAKGNSPRQRVPANRERTFTFEARSEIGLAIREYITEADAIKEVRDELKAKAQGVLSSVTTTTRLAEVWPEAVPFIPKYVPRQLPAVRRDELNAAFGLRAA